MVKYAGKKHPQVGMGDCVQIPMTWLDWSRFNAGYLLGVFVKVIVGGKMHVGCKASVIENCFVILNSSRLKY